jgi:hypothetical protein
MSTSKSISITTDISGAGSYTLSGVSDPSLISNQTASSGTATVGEQNGAVCIWLQNAAPSTLVSVSYVEADPAPAQEPAPAQTAATSQESSAPAPATDAVAKPEDGAEAPVGEEAAGSWATADATAPEVTGTPQVTQSAALAAGWFGSRHNNHADVDYSVPGLGGGQAGTSDAHVGASPGDWDNEYDAPGGVDHGSGSYDGS